MGTTNLKIWLIYLLWSLCREFSKYHFLFGVLIIYAKIMIFTILGSVLFTVGHIVKISTYFIVKIFIYLMVSLAYLYVSAISLYSRTFGSNNVTVYLPNVGVPDSQFDHIWHVIPRTTVWAE